MKYRVTVEQFKETDERGYDRWNDIYKQEVEGLDVPELVGFINDKSIIMRERKDREAAYEINP